MPKIYFKLLLVVFGIRVRFEGKLSKNKTVYISNHTSYLDILILGANLDALFVAKSEIANWPLINRIVKIGKTIFVNRSKKSNASKQVYELNQIIADGYNIILFPEGTSNDGHKVLPFKSSLFSVTDYEVNKDCYMQPISITYTGLDGLPLSRMFKPFFAWYGDMDLLPHAWKFLGLGSSEISVKYHQPVPFTKFDSRKTFSDYCYNQISNQVAYDLTSRNKESIINIFSYKHL
jgi:lyso-ornithine lipid O-acyltransferase|tara:strand:- start:204 stop:905 length:702 start_codon:yes stop_codon:yes gene_type:complete